MTYRRPVLRGGMLFFLALLSWLNIDLTFFTRGSDGFRSGDWLMALAFIPTVGAGYLYVASQLTVTGTHVIVANPLRRAAIPLQHIVDVIPGSNLKIVTAYKSFYAWGVEAANAQMAGDSFGSQDTLRDTILKAARTAPEDCPPAAYRFQPPDLFFCLFLLITLGCSVALRMGIGVNG